MALNILSQIRGSDNILHIKVSGIYSVFSMQKGNCEGIEAVTQKVKFTGGKIMFRRKNVLSIALLLVGCISLTGCAEIRSKLHEFKGNIKGNTYTVDTFDNTGNLMAQMHGENIDIEGNYVESYSVNSDGNFINNYELSSVISITIDGYEMESCGDTLIFYEDGLKPDVAFEPVSEVSTSSDGILDYTSISGRLNKIKNKFGKSRIVVIKSQLGNPIYAFSGDKVYWTIPDDLPKFTKLMIDGKALYIHRSNFQIYDKAMLD